MVMDPNQTVPMAPNAPPMPTGSGPPASADEGAMAAAMAAGPQHGPEHLKKMTKPSHNMAAVQPTNPYAAP